MHVNGSSGLSCCSAFPTLKPKKLRANIGVTPTTGAAMPL